MDWIGWVQDLDVRLIVFFHQHLSTPFLNQLAPLWRHAYFWAPLYLAILVAVLRRKRLALAVITGTLLAFSLSDFITAHLIKPLVARPRPCHLSWLAQQLHILVPCGVGYSFPSTHAANHMAMAVVWSALLPRWLAPLWIAWALSIGLAQYMWAFIFLVTCWSVGSLAF